MSVIAVSAGGDYVFLALEDSGGDQFIARAARSDLSNFIRIYDPAAGSAGNVAQVPANPDKMLFHGNFGTDVTVILHTISTEGNADVSPASLGAKVINTLWPNPSNEDEWLCTVDTDQDLLHTTDAGANYTTLDAALGFDAQALTVLWSGAYFPHRHFVAGEVGVGDLDVLYSPNEGVSDTNVEGATVGAADGIVSLEATGG